MIEGIGNSRTVFHSVVILGGDDALHSFQRKKLETRSWTWTVKEQIC